MVVLRLLRGRTCAGGAAFVLVLLAEARLEVAVDAPLGHERPVVALRATRALRAAALVAVGLDALKRVKMFNVIILCIPFSKTYSILSKTSFIH